jgi:hypothetical protein
MMVRVPGEAGLPTCRLMLMYAAETGVALGAGRHVLGYRDDLFPGTGGMKRVLLFRTEGFRVEEQHPPFFSREDDPFDYARYDPENLPQVRSARLVFESAGREEETAGRRSGANAGAAAPPGEGFLDAVGTPGGIPDRQATRIMDLIRGEWEITALLAALLGLAITAHYAVLLARGFVLFPWLM